MPLFMMYSFVACGYMLGLQLMMSNPRIDVRPRQLAVILLPVAGMLSLVLHLCTQVLGGPEDILLLFSVLFPFAAIALGVMGMKRHGQRVNRVMVALFGAAILAIGYVTLFSRDGTSSTKVLFGFYKVQQAFTTGSFQPLEHVLMNIILFLPFGFLMTGCCPGKSDKLLYVLACAYIFTTSIEAIQYVLRIGECDLEDLVANVLGGVAGWGAYKLFVRTR